MSPVITTPPKLSKNISPSIKVKSPRSEIKLHKLNVSDTTKTSPELAVRGTISTHHTPSDDTDRITQAWNRLKINALSKAIAIAPEVEHCTIGPKSLSAVDRDDDDHDAGENNQPNLRRRVMCSTPMRLKLVDVEVKRYVGPTDSVQNLSFDISEIRTDSNTSLVDNEIIDFELLKMICLNSIEEQIIKQGEKKKQLQLKKWLETQEKLKEKLMAQKVEMDLQTEIRKQNQYIESQKIITESKETAQVKAQQEQQCKSDHDKKIAEASERLKEIEQKRKELEEKHKQKQEEIKRCINGIYDVQVSYGQKYSQITETTKKCRDVRMLYEKVSGELQKLKEMNELLLKLVERSREGKVSLSDLKAAENLVQQITAIGDIFSTHAEHINRSHEKSEEDKKKEDAEKELRLKQEEAEHQQRIRQENEKLEKETPKPTKIPVKISDGIEDCISRECLREHLELQRYLVDFENKLEPLLTNDSLKKFRFDCQKVVNVPVNAISPLDDLHLEDKWYKLSRLLQGQAVPLGTTLFLATGHPLGVAYCTNLLAKKFVKQGEHTVSSKPEAAFAIAAVIVSLWADFPEFGRLLLAHFHRECPYLIPAFMPQTEGQTNEEYYKMLGYQYSEDGKVETQDKFLRRMSGVMRLYAAILVTPLKRSVLAEGKKHPHNMKEAWRWLAASLNLNPRPDISPTLLFHFLEVTGQMFFRTYGLQFTKLLHVLCADYFPLIEKVTPDGCGGPVVRLKSFLEKVLKEGEVPSPPGLLPPNFW